MSYDSFARGPAPVGVRTIELHDESRGGRTLTVELWYPAMDAYRGQDLDDATRDRFPIALGIPDGVQDAVRGAEPAVGRFPLILCSHGANGHRRINAALCTHLASHGYIVASNDVPGNTIGDVMRDADAATRGAPATRPSQDDVNQKRTRDAAFVFDRVIAGAEPALAALVDSARIGTCGHSSGGWTSLALNSVDLRPVASFVMAPLWGKNRLVPQVARVAARLRLDDWKRPVATFVLAGDRDAFIMLDDLRELYGKLMPPKRFAVLQQAGHEHFHDDAELYHETQRQMYLSGNFPDPEIDTAALAQAMGSFSELCPATHGLDAMRALCLAHMDEHLKGSAEARAFLNGDLARTFAVRGIGLEVTGPVLDRLAAEEQYTDTLEQTHDTPRETIELKSSQLVEHVKQLIHEGNVRRIVVKQDERTIVEFPLAVGVVGTLLAAPLAALGALAALLNDCTIEVEREEPVSAAESPAVEQAVG
jgi:dienelactone hydrolase